LDKKSWQFEWYKFTVRHRFVNCLAGAGGFKHAYKPPLNKPSS